MVTPSIFAYQDYRSFIDDWFEVWRRVGKPVTYQEFATKAGCSPAMVQHVRVGERKLKLPFAAKFALGLGLDADATIQLELLIRLEQVPRQAKPAIRGALAAGRLASLGQALGGDAWQARALLREILRKILDHGGPAPSTEALSSLLLLPVEPAHLLAALGDLVDGAATPEADMSEQQLDAISAGLLAVPPRNRDFRTALWQIPAADQPELRTIVPTIYLAKPARPGKTRRLVLIYDFELTCAELSEMTRS